MVASWRRARSHSLVFVPVIMSTVADKNEIARFRPVSQKFLHYKSENETKKTLLRRWPLAAKMAIKSWLSVPHVNGATTGLQQCGFKWFLCIVGLSNVGAMGLKQRCFACCLGETNGGILQEVARSHDPQSRSLLRCLLPPSSNQVYLSCVRELFRKNELFGMQVFSMRLLPFGQDIIICNLGSFVNKICDKNTHRFFFLDGKTFCQ